MNQSDNPTVSVIIPTYNRGNLLARAVTSVLNQTFNDYELIIVDDASTDTTYDMIGKFNDKRIKYMRQDSNKGGGAARNTGIKASQGKYIAFLDSDDEWLPTKLKKQVDLFNRSPEQVGLIYTWLAHVYENEKMKYSRPMSKGRVYKELLVRNIVGSTSSAIIRRSVLTLVKGFDESLPARQDMDLWIRIAEHFDFDLVPEILVKIYHRHGSERISSRKNMLLTARELFYQKHKQRLINEGVAHLYLCAIGQFYREYFDDTARTHHYFQEAIKANPKSFRPYMLLISTFLPKPLYKALRSIKRSIEAGLSNLFSKRTLKPPCLDGE